MPDNPRSTASVAGHPIHAMLAPIPVVCFIGTFLTDLAYWQTASVMWETFSIWLLAAGLVVAFFAVIYAWFAIVITGRYPQGAYDLVAGYNKLAAGTYGYMGRVLRDRKRRGPGSVHPQRLRSQPGRLYGRGADRPDPLRPRGSHPAGDSVGRPGLGLSSSRGSR